MLSKDTLDYCLVVLTHGPDRTLTRTLESFLDNVDPLPTDWRVASDGPVGRKAALDWEALQGDGHRWQGVSASWKSEGYCKATARAWDTASYTDSPWVFYLEHDFEFLRPFDLEDFAQVMIEHPMIPQAALMRDAVNEYELLADGLFESRPGQYLQHHNGNGSPWLEQRSYLTTNPSLLNTKFMQEHPWPEHESECEGKFGLELIEAGFTFGVMGEGEPWCRHIGQRDGFGY